MAKKDHTNFIVGLDFGTTKICAVIGQYKNGRWEIVGLGKSPSTGIRKGVVINIEATTESVKKAIEEAELLSGVKIDQVYVGIAGSHIKGFNSSGVVAIKNKEVTSEDIERVLDAARAVSVPADREIIHALPHEFIIDDQDGIREPLGMSGVRLEVKVHLVTASISAAQNIIKCANRAGVKVLDVILEPIASAESVLSSDERELGVLLLDIGGGTSDIAVFQQGSIVHSAVIPVGGNHITSDLATGIRASLTDAEQIKRLHGCAMSSLVKQEEMVSVPTIGGRETRPISKKYIAEIIEMRVEELFQLVQAELRSSGFIDNIPSGVVLTGGATLLKGIAELAERVLDMPVKQASPQEEGSLSDVLESPMYATGIGLVRFAAKMAQDTHSASKGAKRDVSSQKSLKFSEAVKRWFEQIF